MDTGQALKFMAQSRLARRREFPLLRRSRHHKRRDGEVLAPPKVSSTGRRACRSVRSAIITPWNYAVHALDLENCAGARRPAVRFVHKPAEFFPR